MYVLTLGIIYQIIRVITVVYGANSCSTLLKNILKRYAVVSTALLQVAHLKSLRSNQKPFLLLNSHIPASTPVQTIPSPKNRRSRGGNRVA